MHLQGPLVLDEAYVDFTDSNGLCLTVPERRCHAHAEQVLLAGGHPLRLRRGHPALIREFIKVKDSYNCDALSLAAATAALEDQEYLRTTRAKIVATRQRMTQALRQLGFDVCSSQANFVWCRHREQPAKAIFEGLKRRMILVRYMAYEGYGDGLRMSAGDEMERFDVLLKEIQQFV